MLSKFQPLTGDQEEVLENLLEKHWAIVARRPNPEKITVAIERFGNFTTCVLKRGKRMFSGCSKLSTVDIKAAKMGKYKYSQVTGDMFALNNAFRNLLDFEPRNGCNRGNGHIEPPTVTESNPSDVMTTGS